MILSALIPIQLQIPDDEKILLEIFEDDEDKKGPEPLDITDIAASLIARSISFRLTDAEEGKDIGMIITPDDLHVHVNHKEISKEEALEHLVRGVIDVIMEAAYETLKEMEDET